MTKKSHFEIYGELARQETDLTRINGRYDSQKEGELKIAEDIMSKLNIKSSDVVLDIGCGTGIISKEISKKALKVVGCDHGDVVRIAQRMNASDNIDFISTDFNKYESSIKFDKILLYGVISTLPSIKTLEVFFEKSINLLKPSGRFLIGDIPNQDKKNRFLKSKRGKIFQQEWEKKSNNNDHLSLFSDVEETILFDDEVVFYILSYFRKKGFHSYIIDQLQSLPFGNTREDILIIGSEYED